MPRGRHLSRKAVGWTLSPRTEEEEIRLNEYATFEEARTRLATKSPSGGPAASPERRLEVVLTPVPSTRLRIHSVA